MCDYRALADTSTVRVTPAHMGHVKLAFGGVNTNGHPITVTVVMPWWLWPLLAKEAAKAWVVEKAKRIREIGIMNRSFASPISEEPPAFTSGAPQGGCADEWGGLGAPGEPT